MLTHRNVLCINITVKSLPTYRNSIRVLLPDFFSFRTPLFKAVFFLVLPTHFHAYFAKFVSNNHSYQPFLFTYAVNMAVNKRDVTGEHELELSPIQIMTT